jgi:hypothetical protein
MRMPPCAPPSPMNVVHGLTAQSVPSIRSSRSGDSRCSIRVSRGFPGTKRSRTGHFQDHHAATLSRDATVGLAPCPRRRSRTAAARSSRAPSAATSDTATALRRTASLMEGAEGTTWRTASARPRTPPRLQGDVPLRDRGSAAPSRCSRLLRSSDSPTRRRRWASRPRAPWPAARPAPGAARPRCCPASARRPCGRRAAAG